MSADLQTGLSKIRERAGVVNADLLSFEVHGYVQHSTSTMQCPQQRHMATERAVIPEDSKEQVEDAPVLSQPDNTCMIGAM